MMIFVQDKIRDATTQDEKEYVKSLSQYAIDETIETDGLTLYWSEPGRTARYSTQSATGRREGRNEDHNEL